VVSRSFKSIYCLMPAKAGTAAEPFQCNPTQASGQSPPMLQLVPRPKAVELP
jgi:hypothetical protein